MKIFKNSALIIMAILFSMNIVHAQKISAGAGSSSSNTSIAITPQSKEKGEEVKEPVQTQNKQEMVDKVLAHFDTELQSSTISENTSLAASISGEMGYASCEVYGTYVGVCLCRTMASHDPWMLPIDICVGDGSSENASDDLLTNFEERILNMENQINEKIGEMSPDISVEQCGDPSTVIQAIDCQRVRIELAFAEMSAREEKMLNKQKDILTDMEKDMLQAELALQMGGSKSGLACEQVSNRLGAAAIAKRTEGNYQLISNTMAGINTLSTDVLKTISGRDDEEYKPSIAGAARARKDSSMYFLTEGDFSENASIDLAPVTFDEAGEIVGVKAPMGMPEGSKFDTVLPGADRNYAGMVLDRPVIKSDQHMFAALNSAVNLVNPLPEANSLASTLNSSSARIQFAKDKSKQARYAISGDVVNSSIALRSITMGDELEPGTKEKISSSANYIRGNLQKLGADATEITDLGDDISEYQFIDAMVRRIPQTPGYQAILANENPIDIDTEIVKSLATTLAIKWKQYQLLEKMLASRATTLAVNIEEMQK